jgi:tetratricopeptide (TPR) repeat protein
MDVDAAPAAPTDPAAAAEEYKLRGNNEYKAKSYGSAHRLYSEAVKLAPANATYLINRAAAALMLERASDALSDCQAALEVDPTLIKAHVRASKALVQLGRVSDARRQLELAATLPTADGTIAPELGALTELDSSIRTAKEALAQESGAAHREALRLFTQISERCPQSETMACLQMEALMKAQPKHGAAQVVAQSARWLRISSDNPDLLCVRGKGLYASGQVTLSHSSRPLAAAAIHAAVANV